MIFWDEIVNYDRNVNRLQHGLFGGLYVRHMQGDSIVTLLSHFEWQPLIFPDILDGQAKSKLELNSSTQLFSSPPEQLSITGGKHADLVRFHFKFKLKVSNGHCPLAHVPTVISCYKSFSIPQKSYFTAFSPLSLLRTATHCPHPTRTHSGGHVVTFGPRSLLDVRSS